MVLRLVLRFLNWIGWQRLSIWALLWLALSTMIWTMTDLQPGLSSAFLLPIALLGLLLGWALATTRVVPAWLAGLLLLGLGLEIVVVAVGNFEPAFVSFVENLFRLGWQSWRQPFDIVWSDLAEVAGPLAEIWHGLQTIGIRSLAWSASLIWGEPLPDPVARTLAWGLAVWMVSAWAGWIIRRQLQPLVALLPAGVLLATLLAYHPRQADNLLPFVAAALALMGLLPMIGLEQRWQTTNTDFPETLRTEMTFAVIPISVMLFIVASFAPNISIWRIARQARTLFDDAPASRNEGPAPPPTSGEEPPAENSDAPLALRSPGLPRSHLLGSGPELSEKVALIVHTPAASAASTAPRYYWRSLTYDGYSGRGWYTEETEKIDYQPQENAAKPLPHQATLRQEIEVVSSNTTLFYAAGEIAALDQPYSVYWRGTNDPFAVAGKPETYRVESFVPAGASPAALRQAGTAYPAAIRNRYLRLPDSIPERVLTLARDLTATAPTPYDRAKAIERYVRQFPYSLDLPEPPHGRDMVDYFLFDLQSGYCDYYASSMVVLARAAGLPARLAVGYATGTYNAAEATYLVTEAEAHSWAEIYFPDYGWVKFEPTAARPSDDAQAQTEPVASAEPPANSDSRSDSIFQTAAVRRWGPFMAAAISLLVLGILAWPAIDRWRLGRMAPARTISLLYHRLQQAGDRLATAAHQSDTPQEHAKALTTRVDSLALNDRLRTLLAPVPADIDRLTQLYVQTIFSPHPPGSEHRSQAIDAWQQLRRRLWLAWLVQLWPAWSNRAAKRQSRAG